MRVLTKKIISIIYFLIRADTKKGRLIRGLALLHGGVKSVDFTPLFYFQSTSYRRGQRPHESPRHVSLTENSPAFQPLSPTWFLKTGCGIQLAEDNGADAIWPFASWHPRNGCSSGPHDLCWPRDSRLPTTFLSCA